MTIDERLTQLGIQLPKAAAPVASYVPVVTVGQMAYVSGQLPFIDGELVTGRLGEDVDLELGMRAARACGLMILAQLKAALGSLDKVVNGCSDLMVDVFGEAGKHARSAVGVPVLPLGAAVEVDAIVSLVA